MQTNRGQLRLRMPGLTACLRTHWLFPIVSPVLLPFLHKRPELGWLKPQLHKAIQSFVHNNNNNNTTPTKTGKTDAPTTKRPRTLAAIPRRCAASTATSEPKNCKSSASSLNSPTVERGRWLFRPHPRHSCRLCFLSLWCGRGQRQFGKGGALGYPSLSPGERRIRPPYTGVL